MADYNTYNTRDYAGNGVVSLAYKDPANGAPLGLQDMGNCTALSISNSTEWREKREHRSGKQKRVKRLIRQSDFGVSMTLESTAAEVLTRLYFGTVTALATATVTAEPAKAYVGKKTKLARINLTTFTSLTNVGGATTYVLGTDYTVDLKAGVIEIPAGSAIADGADVRANYVAGASERMAAYNDTLRPVYLLFQGLNTSENDAPVVIEVFKIRFSPPSEWQLIQEDGFTSFEIQGEMELDDNFAALGGLWHETQLQAA